MNYEELLKNRVTKVGDFTVKYGNYNEIYVLIYDAWIKIPVDCKDVEAFVAEQEEQERPVIRYIIESARWSDNKAYKKIFTDLEEAKDVVVRELNSYAEWASQNLYLAFYIVNRNKICKTMEEVKEIVEREGEESITAGYHIGEKPTDISEISTYDPVAYLPLDHTHEELIMNIKERYYTARSISRIKIKTKNLPKLEEQLMNDPYIDVSYEGAGGATYHIITSDRHGNKKYNVWDVK